MSAIVSRKELVRKLMGYFSLSRCGCDKMPESIFAHPACHTSKARIYGTSEYIDVHGGWHDAGDYGRYVLPACKAAADLLLAYTFDSELFSGIDILDEVRWELDWLLRMQRSDGAVYHKVSCMGFCGFVSPEEEKEELVVSPVSTEATADFCGTCALAAIIYVKSDPEYAKLLEKRAMLAWAFLSVHDRIPFYNPSDITTGEYGAGENTSDVDERFFAACAIFCLNQNASCLDYANRTIENPAVNASLGWAEMGGYGLILIALYDKSDEKLKEKCIKEIIDSGNDIAFRSLKDNYGVPLEHYPWGSNMNVLNSAVITGITHKINGNESCEKASKRMLSYIFGRNPLNICYVTGEAGFTGISPVHPHHRPSVALNAVMPGMVVGGPDEYLHDECAKKCLSDKPANECYIDATESYSTNEVAIYWNSPMVLLLSLIKQEIYA